MTTLNIETTSLKWSDFNNPVSGPNNKFIFGQMDLKQVQYATNFQEKSAKPLYIRGLL